MLGLGLLTLKKSSKVRIREDFGFFIRWDVRVHPLKLKELFKVKAKFQGRIDYAFFIPKCLVRNSKFQ